MAAVPRGRPDEEWIAEREKTVSDAVSPLNAEIEELKKQLEEAKAAAAKREQELQENSKANIERLVDLLYFATTLDPFALQHEVSHYERHVCLVYAQQTGSTLSLADITNLAVFSRMLTTRAFNSHLSHVVCDCAVPVGMMESKVSMYQGLCVVHFPLFHPFPHTCYESGKNLLDLHSPYYPL